MSTCYDSKDSLTPLDALANIREILYLSTEGSRFVWDPDKEWDADTTERIAEVIRPFFPTLTEITSVK